MTTVAQLRKAALYLPEVEVVTHFGMMAFAVRGKGFASVTKEGAVQLWLSDEESDAFLTKHPTGERLVRNGTPIGIRIALSDINGKDLNAVVRAAWSCHAPNRLAASVARTQGGADQQEGDLPTSIGKPAMRALHGAGLTTLDQVATRTEAELLALHGIGPKAIRILTETLEQQDQSLR